MTFFLLFGFIALFEGGERERRERGEIEERERRQTGDREEIE
jgi:hypothetical protein